MIVRVLGSAAGGGVPQWNCACTNCTAARTGRQPRRTQSSLALSADGDAWLLLNISPDITWQIEAYGPLQPRASARGTPIGGGLLTDANVDHLGGLAALRQQGDHRFTLRSSALVREIATRQVAFAAFAQPPHTWLDVPLDGEFTLGADGELVVRGVAVAGLTPGFAGRRAERGAVIAYAIRDRRSGGALLFAPVFSTVDEELARAIGEADVAFLDGSFFSDDEMPTQGLGWKRARALGHQPVGGDGGTLAAIRTFANRRIFTHLNNSNPMLDPDSEAASRVREAGAEIAEDGMELVL